MISKHSWCVCVGVSTRAVSNRGSEEGLGVSQQHRSLLAAAWEDSSAHPGIRDQVLREGKVCWSQGFVPRNPISGFCSPQQEHEQLSYSSTRTKAPSVIISGLKAATWYIFCVRTRTAAGYSSYSPKYEYETTGDCECRAENSPVSIRLCLCSPRSFCVA